MIGQHLIPLLYLLCTEYTIGVDGQVFNYTAHVGRLGYTRYTTVIAKHTWFGAYSHCRDINLGKLMQSGETGLLFVNIRHQLLIRGWNQSEYIWTGMVKPQSESTYYKASSGPCVALPGLVADSLDPTDQQCLAVNMTSDNPDIDWFGTNCSNTYYFVCADQMGPPQTVQHTNYDITDIFDDTSVYMTTTSLDQVSCLDLCSTYLEGFAVIYDVPSSSCEVFYSAANAFPVNVFVRGNTTLDNTVCIKTTPQALGYLDAGPFLSGATNETVPCAMTTTTSITTTTEAATTETSGTTTTTASTTTTTAAATTETSDTSTGMGTTTIGTTAGLGTTTFDTEVTSAVKCSTYSMCSCGGTVSLNSEELAQRVEKLKKELTVVKNQLSSYKRKRTSASDSRTSAKLMGGAGACIIAALVMLIVILDMRNLFNCASCHKSRQQP